MNCSRCRRRTVVDGRKQCDRCLQRLAVRRAAYAASGLCRNCGREAMSGFTKCAGCKQADADRRRSDVADALVAYGGPVCVCCGETIATFLTLDHINNDGGGSNREIRGASYYIRLRLLKYPPGLQVLCFNCNLAKERNHGVLVYDDANFACGCVGSKKCNHGYSASARSRRRFLLKTIEVYGGLCSCCSESNPFKLTLDHLSNDGSKHRRDSCTMDTASWLRVNGYPDDMNISVRCANCNCGRARNDGICPHGVML